MKFVPDHQRHSPRLKNYDYAQEGVYFVTICTQDRLCLFAHISSIIGRIGRLMQTTRRIYQMQGRTRTVGSSVSALGSE